MKDKDKKSPVKDNAQVLGYISEGNPNIQNTQKGSSDQQSTQVVKQAIKDDQALAAVAKDIKVTVEDGTITLDGEVSTDQQSNLAGNTAKALGVTVKVDNRIEVVHK